MPQPKLKENLIYATRPFVTDFQEQSWIEAVAPYFEFLYNSRQTKLKDNQPYENFSFHNDSFSVLRLNKQLRNILSVLTENSTDVFSMEKVVEEVSIKKVENKFQE